MEVGFSQIQSQLCILVLIVLLKLSTPYSDERTVIKL